MNTSMCFTAKWFFLLCAFCVGSYAKKSVEVYCRKDDIKTETDLVYTWKEKTQRDSTLYSASSNLICMNSKTNSLLIRKCDPLTGEWAPPASLISCANAKYPKNIFCPEEFVEIAVKGSFVCLKISNIEDVFDGKYCYGSDTVFDELSRKSDELKRILEYLFFKRKIRRFWMPVRRAKYNDDFNPFVIQLPGSRWGDFYHIPNQALSINEFFSENDCLSVQIIEFENELTYRIHITNCNEHHPMVCLFRENFVAYSGCPQFFGALSHKPNECFGIEWEAGLFPNDLRTLSIADYIEKRNSLNQIFKSIDLEFEKMFYVGNFSNENGEKFAIKMNGDEEFCIEPYTKSKLPALSSEILSNHNRKSVDMVLSLNLQLGGIILTIYNRNYIFRFSDELFGVKCFTNSKKDSEQWKAVKIKLIWENDLETKSLFKVKQGERDGYYWCEAHTIFNFSLVQTKRMFLSQEEKDHSFAMLVNISCDNTDCSNLYTSKTWKRLGKQAEKTLDNLISKNEQEFEYLKISKTRLMDISAVLHNGNILQCLLHVWASLKSSTSDRDSSEEDEYELLSNNVLNNQIKVINLLTKLMSSFTPRKFTTARSTRFCFSEAFLMEDNQENFWQITEHGKSSTTLKLCLKENGEPFIRSCLGNFLTGAYWEDMKKIQCSSSFYKKNQITVRLHDLERKNLEKSSPDVVINFMHELLYNNVKKLVPIDFYLISRIMHSAMLSLSGEESTIVYENIGTNISYIYNFLMDVDKNVLKTSLALNFTNVLLEAFENIIDNMAVKIVIENLPGGETSQFTEPNENEISQNNEELIKNVHFEDIGVLVKIAKNFIIFIIDPYVAEVTGIALFRKTDNITFENNNWEETLYGYFQNEFFKFILANQTVDDLMYESDLEMASFVPQSLWKRLDEISQTANVTLLQRPRPRFVFKIFANDILFLESSDGNQNNTEAPLTGRIISVSIPGHDKDLPEMLPLIFKTQSIDNNSEPDCSYWDYKTWAFDGMSFLGRSEVDNSIILCGCTHLTPFVYLISDRNQLSVDPQFKTIVTMHEEILDIITILGCSLSLFGMVSIFITAVIFQSWRQKASSKVLLNLSAAISLQMILFCFINTGETSYNLMVNDILSSCIAIGALLHYSVLVEFFWMLIIGYLQFKRYVQVFSSSRPTRFFEKSFLIGWCAPTIPVAIVLISDYNSYIPNIEFPEKQSICYPTGYSLYLGIILPITLIIVFNLFIYFIIVYNIVRQPIRTIRHTEKDLVVSQLRLSVILFFLLGFTWIFGLLATLKANIIFSYLFCCTATIQGFVLFIYFIILDPKTRRLWRGFFHNFLMCECNENYEFSMSMTDTNRTQL